MKKITGLKLGIVLMTSLCLGACSSSKSESSSDSREQLVLATNQGNTGYMQKALEKLASEYNKTQKNVTIKVQALADYEPTMKTKMAANDLPEMFFTHGWSTVRYKEYLEPLQNQKWTKNINPLIKDRITDKKGNIYVLPMNVGVNGVVFDEEVLNKCGIDWQSIKTWSDFDNACKIVKEKGYTAIGQGGLQESWTIANFIDYTSSSILTNENKENQERLLDGSFNWKNDFSPVYDMFMDYYDKGYFNKNIREGTSQDIIEAFADHKVAFNVGSTNIVQEVQRINKDAKLGIMPIPTNKDTEKPSMLCGEDCAFGIWKDGKHKKEALKFLDYMSETKQINAIAEATYSPTGIVGDKYYSNAGNLSKYYETMTQYQSVGYFDRDFLPSGMWDTITKAGESMVNKAGSKAEILGKIQEDYDKLSKQ